MEILNARNEMSALSYLSASHHWHHQVFRNYASIFNKEKVIKFLTLGNVTIVLEPPLNYRLLNSVALFSRSQFQYHLKRNIPAILHIHCETVTSCPDSCTPPHTYSTRLRLCCLTIKIPGIIVKRNYCKEHCTGNREAGSYSIDGGRRRRWWIENIKLK